MLCDSVPRMIPFFPKIGFFSTNDNENDNAPSWAMGGSHRAMAFVSPFDAISRQARYGPSAPKEHGVLGASPIAVRRCVLGTSPIAAAPQEHGVLGASPIAVRRCVLGASPIAAAPKEHGVLGASPIAVRRCVLGTSPIAAAKKRQNDSTMCRIVVILGRFRRCTQETLPIAW